MAVKRIAFICLWEIILMSAWMVPGEGVKFFIPGEELDTSSAKVVYPRRLSNNDEIKECLSTKEKTGHHVSEVSFVIPSHNDEHIVDLKQNKELVSRSFLVRSFQADGTPVMKTSKPENCHYHGKIRGNEGSTAVMSTCKGLRGYIDDGKERVYVEPVDLKTNGAHKIYQVKQHNHKERVCRTSHSHAIRSKNGKEGKTWNDNKSSNRTTRRVRRGIDEFYRPYFTTEETRYTELMIAVDNNLYKYFGNEEEEVTNRMITLVNAVDKQFRCWTNWDGWLTKLNALEKWFPSEAV